MSIDYITLLLVNTIIGLLAGAWFVWRGLDGPNHKPWAAVFAVAGGVLLIVGLHMTLTWPIQDVHTPDKVIHLRFANSAFGEMSVLFGALLAAIALALAKGWDLRPVSVYAFFVGVTAIVLGACTIHCWMTAVPSLTAAGYLLSGAGAVLAAVALWAPRLKAIRLASAALLALSALTWIATAFPGYWKHMEMLSGKV